MVTATEARARYRAALQKAGLSVILRRYSGVGLSRSATNATVLARVVDYEPHALVGNVLQGDRKAIVLAEDVETAAWSDPPRKNDKLVVDGRELNIEAVDDSTRRIGDTLIAYEMQVRG